ncbi:MAG: Ig-like domain-containing protein, partial [Gemmatimonadaceae bacterium]
MRAVHRSITFAAVAVLAGLTILSCGGATDPGGGGGGGGAKVVVTPATDSIVIGSSVTLSVRVVNAQGQTVNGAKVFWNTSNANIATVSSNGAVTSIDTGTVQIAASSNGVSGLSN